MNQSDPVIDEIRAVRHRISARFHHDPALLVAYYMELQDQYRGRLVVTNKASAAVELSRPPGVRPDARKAPRPGQRRR